jgi:tyrosinase
MFAYDSATLTAAHRAAIEDIAQRMVRSNAAAVNIVGHASPEGPAAYNLALGQRRADAVAAALREALDRSRAGAGARIRFSVTSRGEANTISREASRNRRVDVCFVEAAPPIVPPQTRTRIRYSIDTPEGRAMLQKYEQAVRLMMAEPAASPRSWLFQWYTHAVRDDRGKTAEINRVYGSSPSANRTLALAMWNTCQAHHPGNNEQFFLPWHRMYVDFFERICRRVLNDDSFTLPYWNYSRSGASALPAAFRAPGSSLFRVDRNPGINNGAPIDQNSPPGSLSAVPALSRQNYGPQGVAPGFNDFLDGDLHGNVHVAIGNRRGMGAVPWAASDPIFWLHHCNIDRLWASWNRAGRRNPTDAGWLNTTFTFADENGRQVVAAVRDFSTTSARGYTYDQFEPVPGAQPVSEAIMAGEAGADQDRRPIPVASAQRSTRPDGGISLGAGPLTVHLAPHEGAVFADQIEALGDEHRLYLVISNYKAEAQPGVLYHVYLDLPSGPGEPHREGHYVGTMNFFDAVPHSGHQHATMTGKTRSFDVTDVVRQLRTEGRTGSAPSVTIVPAGRPASEARPVIGDISLLAQ